jgi:hypothetical protein
LDLKIVFDLSPIFEAFDESSAFWFVLLLRGRRDNLRAGEFHNTWNEHPNTGQWHD